MTYHRRQRDESTENSRAWTNELFLFLNSWIPVQLITKIHFWTIPYSMETRKNVQKRLVAFSEFFQICFFFFLFYYLNNSVISTHRFFSNSLENDIHLHSRWSLRTTTKCFYSYLHVWHILYAYVCVCVYLEEISS